MGSTTETLTIAADGSEPNIITLETSTPDTITAENVHLYFPGTVSYLAPPDDDDSVSINDKELQGHDEKQASYMNEVCILLDKEDGPVGGGSKKISHLMKNIDRGLLHRAFSVFLFDSENRLLLQQRAHGKITFPNMWTNTCCSHPLNRPEEAGIDLEAGKQGAKRAAVRKLWDELRIKVAPEKIEEFVSQFRFVARIQYMAVNISPEDEDKEWGEHEIDYILFIKINIDHTANPEEARDTRYVTQDQLKAMRDDKTLQFTPWFSLICDKVLYQWWDRLDEIIEDTKESTSESGIRRW